MSAPEEVIVNLESYFPSSGTEGAVFESRWCNRCKHYQGCEIWGDAFVMGREPKEWRTLPTIDANIGICLAFELEVTK